MDNDDIERRLVKCFSVIFPQLAENAIPAATMQTVEGWDSVATVTLLNVVEEEFGFQIGWEEVEQMLSFKQLADYLSGRMMPGLAGTRQVDGIRP